MQKNTPSLFFEINDSTYIFVAGIFDDNQKFKIIEKITVPSDGIENNKFIDIDQLSKSIKKKYRGN